MAVVKEQSGSQVYSHCATIQVRARAPALERVPVYKGTRDVTEVNYAVYEAVKNLEVDSSRVDAV